ncbi:MAG: protein translocase subunit SecD [Ignavibacteriales bacterium]|jgi:preprotein translocase subunit SecD|nr:protein translocase subunit SecD [Ignavibacterium sp.]MCZ2270271.1 protein translocase subunit SecD [Ignavibacteriales bacterium]MDD5607908.1 protein translocase subunit SecD [Ignavibacterium sp.]MDX9711038.1 protein translocase subunit SecD [Ignavibacteriaceae bacterium]GIK20985.1 MAG: protein translocase subunit SecD [Ignavibacteriota bacterium]
MKEFRFKIIIVLAAVLLSIYLLYPTYQDYQNTKFLTAALETKRNELKKQYPDLPKDKIEQMVTLTEDSIKVADPSILDARKKRIKLGLDLQGGMRVVLEVNTAKLLEKIANNPDDVFKKVIADAQKEASITDESVVNIIGREFQKRNIRLSRYYGTIRQDDGEILDELKKSSEDAVNRAMEIIRNRVDQYGVSEPSISRQGSRRIIVELPGVAKEEEAKQLLQGTALLEFRLVKDAEFTFPIMQRIDDVLAKRTKSGVKDSLGNEVAATENTETSDTTAANDTTKQLSEEEFKQQHPFFSAAVLNPQSPFADAYVSQDDKNKVEYWLTLPEVQKVIPDNVEFVFSAKPVNTQDVKKIYVLYLVNKTPELTGGVITDAQANLDPNTSSPIVNMEMNSEGATEWARITGANVGKRLAIMLDGVVFTAPNIKGKIPGGRSQIEGSANIDEAKLLEIVLKAGALPAPVDVIEQRIVGPSLGQDSVSSGFNSALFGYLLVGLFMILYYRQAGTIASLALVLVLLFILGVLAGFNATLTLPGIAGIVLTIGMAVDANVLIFERIREEMATGKTMRASVDSGFSRAYSAIIDSNITTFFTGVILYQFGTGPVQGFALTLMIGIATSLFGALVITKLMMDYLVAKGAKISIG